MVEMEGIEPSSQSATGINPWDLLEAFTTVSYHAQLTCLQTDRNQIHPRHHTIAMEGGVPGINLFNFLPTKQDDLCHLPTYAPQLPYG